MKRMITFYVSILVFFLAILTSPILRAQNSQIEISGIRSEKGKIILNIFKNNDSYDNGKVLKKLVFDKKDIIKGKMTVTCNLDPGICGITLIDDENENGEINKNLLGIPKEGFGFSNFFMEKMKKPSFNDFKVDIKNQDNKISIKVKYM
ncbi:DUF2141 domain-containing protein [Flavobacterium sp. LS1R49]|uniref:DUF2141 domain-containing protein n=1 Tax=Flavobacterium shii TaxID=2987687 RepID=A0A9X3C777_9FLAO|nr:DUF2141 domain-containing protein [Flavobacterium shii]MCV9927898.1 DUF2141 domain-containing protein [Flavobacterium shii]